MGFGFEVEVASWFGGLLDDLHCCCFGVELAGWNRNGLVLAYLK